MAGHQPALDVGIGGDEGRDRVLTALGPDEEGTRGWVADRPGGQQPAGFDLPRDVRQVLLAQLCGYSIREDDDTGEIELVPVA